MDSRPPMSLRDALSAEDDIMELYDLAITAHHYRQSATLVLPAEPMTALLARTHIQNWLEQGNWPDEKLADIEHVINEAIRNAIERAYPSRTGVVEVTMTIDPLDSRQAQRPQVVVRDHGRWRPITNNPRGTIREIRLTTDSITTVIIYRNHHKNHWDAKVALTDAPVSAA